MLQTKADTETYTETYAKAYSKANAETYTETYTETYANTNTHKIKMAGGCSRISLAPPLFKIKPDFKKSGFILF